MAAPKKNAVEQVLEMQQDMNALTVDKINETAPKAVEVEEKVNYKKLAEKEGVQYIEPLRKLNAFGTLPDKQLKEHTRDWEYVKGVFENHVINGEPITFWYSKYAGDPDCLWQVPCNRPVYVPRMIATHLESCMQYHTFDYVQKPEQNWRKDDFTHNFTATNTFYRGKFRPIGAFA
jgi:hypothetical protein